MKYAIMTFGLISITLSSALVAEKRMVDENAFIQQDISFTPEPERELDEAWLKPPDAPYPFLGGKVERINGALRFMCQGKPLNFVGYSITTDQVLGVPGARQLAEHGVELFIVDVRFEARGESTPEGIFARFKATADRLLEASPNAYIIVRFWIRKAGEDFPLKYPMALLSDSQGNVKWSTGAAWQPNFLNEWRRYNGERLYKFLHLAGQSEYAKHMIGVYIGAMNTGEWWYPRGGNLAWDYSVTRQAVYKHYITLKYGPDNLGKLKKLWNAADDEELFRLPTVEERRVFPVNPDSRSSNYLQIMNLPVSNAAKYFARIIKVVSSGKLLAGMEINSNLNTYRENGTVYLNQLLDTPEIDFLGRPSDYNQRKMGSYSVPPSCVASFNQHNKIWFSEEDIRTHKAYGTLPGAAGHPPPTPWGTRQVMRRQFTAGALSGYLNYLMDFNIYWFQDPAVLDEVERFNRLYPFMLESGLKRSAQIALVSDQDSQLYTNYFANPTLLRNHIMSYVGADYDFYELRDFLNPEIFKKYKMVIFLNIRALSNPERAGIEKIKSGNRMLLWMHDPGIVNLSSYSEDVSENLHRLTGIDLVYSPGVYRGSLQVHVDNFAREFQENFYSNSDIKKMQILASDIVGTTDKAANFYVGNILSNIYSRDPHAVVLGTNLANQPAFVIKKYPNWTSVFTSSCLLSPQIIRALAKKAGCHIFNDDNDVVFAAGDFVAVHSSSAGLKKLNLNSDRPVLEIFSNSVFAPKNKTISYKSRFGETFLFYQGNAADARKNLAEREKQQEKEFAAFKQNYPAPKGATPAFFNHAKTKRPEDSYALLSLPFPGRYGPFKLNAFCPEVVMVSGPYDLSDQNKIKADAHPARALIEPPLPEYCDDMGSFCHLRTPLPSRKEFAPWQAFTAGIWNYLDRFGIGRGQYAFIAFYLECPPNKEVEIFFDDDSGGTVLLNGEKLQGGKGDLGTVVKLPYSSNLIVIETANLTGNNGFTVKIFEPIKNLKLGSTVLHNLQVKDVNIWLAPEGYDKSPNVMKVRD